MGVTRSGPPSVRRGRTRWGAATFVVLSLTACTHGSPRAERSASHVSSSSQFRLAAKSITVAPFGVVHGWSMPTAGHVEGMHVQGNIVVMALIGNPADSTVDPNAPADQIGVLDSATGILRTSPNVNPGWGPMSYPRVDGSYGVRHRPRWAGAVRTLTASSGSYTSSR